MQWVIPQSITSSIGTSSERSRSDTSSLSEMKIPSSVGNKKVQTTREQTGDRSRYSSTDSLAHSMTIVSVGDSLKFECDQNILSDRPELNNQRRTVVVSRESFHDTFGFALQSYTFRRKNQKRTERITYVDYVRNGSPASKAGIRRGDVVVAVNNSTVIGISHSHLVELMSHQLTMRLVLLFQNVARIIALQARSLQLQYILAEKQKLLKKIEEQLQSADLQTPTSSLKSGITTSSKQRGAQPFEEIHNETGGFSNDRTVSSFESLTSEPPQTPPPSRILMRHKFRVALTHMIRVNNAHCTDPEVTRL